MQWTHAAAARQTTMWWYTHGICQQVFVRFYLFRGSVEVRWDKVVVVLGGEEGGVGDGHDEGEEREHRAEERDHGPLAGDSAAHQVLEAHGDRHEAEDDLRGCNQREGERTSTFAASVNRSFWCTNG